MAAASDISWNGPDGTFNLRVAAVICRGEEVLLCTVDGLGYWFLPGGRVRFGEASDTALARELAEELGHELRSETWHLRQRTSSTATGSSMRSVCTTTSPGPPRWLRTICGGGRRLDTGSAGWPSGRSALSGSSLPG